MTLSVWRYAHLALAIVSFVFILLASITGAILSSDPIQEKSLPYKVDSFDTISLAHTIPVLQSQYDEILELSVDHNQFVTLEAFDAQGNEIKSIIDPTNGNILGKPIVKSQFIQWVTSLHRSLFLHETGRFIIGVISFLLLLIAISGTLLIIKRQQGIRNFFKKITKDHLAPYYHVIAGRLLLIPIIILSLTGTYLFLLRFEFINPSENMTSIPTKSVTVSAVQEIKDFVIFRSLHLKDIQKIEFPFDDDPEEFFRVKTKEGELSINQYTGEIVEEIVYPKTKILETLSLDLHTGRTHIIWAIILGIASLNILFFIWSGFAITWKRSQSKLPKNKIDKAKAEIVLLVGSENGTTIGFANKVYQQLIAEGKAVYIAECNQFQHFPQTKYLFVFTSTYGLGEAPSNASRMESLIKKYKQNSVCHFAVVGFGSRAYSDFCGFAIQVNHWLQAQMSKSACIDLTLIDDKNPEEFAVWVKKLNDVLHTELSTTPANYIGKLQKLSSFSVDKKQTFTADDHTFILELSTKEKFQSGDLLAIYPANDYRERLYSIGKINKKIQLVVKKHPNGLGSQFLSQLQENQKFQARIIANPSFHFPNKAKEIICIANGTGIAPFLGIIDENKFAIPLHLYAGFRNQTTLTEYYQKQLDEALQKRKITSYQWAFSREKNNEYVMDIIRKEAISIATSLQNGAVLMICGSLAMQRDVESILEEICSTHLSQNLAFYKEKNQIRTDCY